MKTYIEHSNVVVFEGLYIPKDPANRDYRRFLDEVKRNEAEVVEYVPPKPSWEEIRAQRELLLKETDWVGLNDITKIVNKNDWLEYRQKLRDLPQAFSSPEEVIWPQKPV